MKIFCCGLVTAGRLHVPSNNCGTVECYTVLKISVVFNVVFAMLLISYGSTA